MNKTLKIVPPTMPNFFRYEIRGSSQKQDGFKPDNGIPISTLTEEEANEFAEMMKEEFLKHWRLKKAQNTNNQNENNG